MGSVEELREKFEKHLVDKKQRFLEHRTCGGHFAKRNGLNDIVYCMNYDSCQNQERITEGNHRVKYCTRLTR